MSELVRFKPTNRHLLIIPHFQKEETNSGVLLPEDYNPAQADHAEATVVDVADDCNDQFKHFKFGRIQPDKRIVCDRSMIKEVKLKNKTHYLILENYVIGFYKVPNEN